MPDARYRASLPLLAALLATLFVPVPALAAPTTFVVDTAGDPAPNDGCDQPDDDNPCSLREAVMAANANTGVDTIVFAAGLTGGEPTTVFLERPFVDTPEDQSDGDLDVREPVTIDGGGLVTVDVSRSETELSTYDRVLDIYHPSSASPTTLIGVGITGGHPQLSSGERDGGGIRAQALALVLTDVSVHGNIAPNGRGGGLHFFGGTLEVSGSTFLDNTGNDGGGVWTDALSVEISDSTIAGNTLVSFGDGRESWPAGDGAGVHLLSDSATLNRVTVAANGVEGEEISSPAGVLVSEPPPHGGGVAVSPESEAGATVDIDDVTFHGNFAHEGGALWLGSGFDFFQDAVTIDASTFTDNWADHGGAIYQDGGSLTVTDSTFGGPEEGDGNGAWIAGGAISASLFEFVENGSAQNGVRKKLHVSGSDFIANGAFFQGGAFWVNGSNNGPATDPLLAVTGGSVVGNGSGAGGGFWLGDVAARIDGTVIDANTADGSGNGGGIYVGGAGGTGALDLIDALVSANNAAWGAGLWMGTDDIVRIDGSTFAGNDAEDVGGGIYNQGGSLSVINSTLTLNEAPIDGTALYSGQTAGSSTLTNVTIHENIGEDVEVEAAAVSEGESSGITMTNTIVTDNEPRDCRGSILSGGHNIDSDGTCLTPAPTAAGDQPGVDDIGIGTLGDHGGPTPTLPLLSGSPAIDAGSDAVCEEIAGGVDQRNVERPVDGDGDGEATCDVGAFERTDTFERTDPVVSVSATDDGAEAGPDHGSFTLSLAEPAPEAVTVEFAIGGTGTRGADYTLHRGSAAGAAISGSSVTIGAGTTSVVVAVEVIDDAVVEDDETVVLTLTDATPGSVGTPPAGTVTIVDNDREEQEPGGEDRIETSIEVASLHFERGSAPIVIIARNDEYADALTGAPLARFLDGPILLTTKDVLDPRIATFIRDYLGSTEAYILGETEAISEQVETQLQTEAGITTIRRIGGVNRFETSGDIARFLAAELGPAAFAPTQFHSSGDVHAYVTEGLHPDLLRGWPDAVSVSGLAAEQLHPILLVRRDEVPVETHQALDDIGAESVTIIGGPVAVSNEVEFALALTGVDVERVGGADRYDTSRLVADLMKANGMSPRYTWLATGLSFPDALVAGPAVAIDDGVLLLIHGLDLDASPASEEWLDDNGAAIRFLRFLGGPEAITEAVRAQVRATID